MGKFGLGTGENPNGGTFGGGPTKLWTARGAVVLCCCCCWVVATDTTATVMAVDPEWNLPPSLERETDTTSDSAESCFGIETTKPSSVSFGGSGCTPQGCCCLAPGSFGLSPTLLRGTVPPVLPPNPPNVIPAPSTGEACI